MRTASFAAASDESGRPACRASVTDTDLAEVTLGETGALAGMKPVPMRTVCEAFTRPHAGRS